MVAADAQRKLIAMHSSLSAELIPQAKKLLSPTALAYHCVKVWHAPATEKAPHGIAPTPICQRLGLHSCLADGLTSLTEDAAADTDVGCAQ